MRQEGFFLASAEIAKRAGVEGTRYKTSEGKYILSEKDLRKVNFSVDEYANGLDVTVITEEQAKVYAKKGTLNVSENKPSEVNNDKKEEK